MQMIITTDNQFNDNNNESLRNYFKETVGRVHDSQNYSKKFEKMPKRYEEIVPAWEIQATFAYSHMVTEHRLGFSGGTKACSNYEKRQGSLKNIEMSYRKCGKSGQIVDLGSGVSFLLKYC